MRSGGFFWFRRTLREEHGGTFLVEVHAINHRVTPSPRPSQVKTQCFYLQLLQSKPQVSHPLLSTAELPPPKAPVVLTAPSGISGFSSPPPGSRDPAWFTHGLSAQAFSMRDQVLPLFTLDMTVWPNGVTFHDNGAEAKSLF